MATSIGTATNHYDLFVKLRALAATQLWVELEVSTSTENYFIMWKAPGMSTTEEIYVGIRTYQSISADYYNFEVFGCTGYVSGNVYTAQPGFFSYGVPLWNQAIPYWAICNGQRMAVVAQIETFDESFYLGKLFPYATPSQLPYPLIVCGMLPSASATRYSAIMANPGVSGSEGYRMGFRGSNYNNSATLIKSNLAMRNLQGAWINPLIWPFNCDYGLESRHNETAVALFRNTNNSSGVAAGDYGLYPLTVMTSTQADNSTIPKQVPAWGTFVDYQGDLYGELDGIFKISGFNNSSHNTLIINTKTYFVFRDGTKTGFDDYCAMRLE